MEKFWQPSSDGGLFLGRNVGGGVVVGGESCTGLAEAYKRLGGLVGMILVYEEWRGGLSGLRG